MDRKKITAVLDDVAIASGSMGSKNMMVGNKGLFAFTARVATQDSAARAEGIRGVYHDLLKDVAHRVIVDSNVTPSTVLGKSDITVMVMYTLNIKPPLFQHLRERVLCWLVMVLFMGGKR